MLAIGLPLMLVFMTLWLLLTFTGIGPLAQLLCRRRDERACAAASAAHCTTVQCSSGNKLAVRWTVGTRSPDTPVVIPNGLGATLVTIGPLHDAVVALGFSCLSYDRAGVGFSALRAKPGFSDAAKVCADQKEVMDSSLPAKQTKWLLVGPSMGNTVAQCFIATYPDSVSALVNVDGMPAPFAHRRSRFEAAASLYSLYAALVWTGVLRPFLALAASKLRPLSSEAFPLAANCRGTNELSQFLLLCSAGNGDYKWKNLPRSAEEMGGVDAPYTSAEDAATLAAELRSGARRSFACRVAETGGARAEREILTL